MIYLDSAATTVQKPKAVREAVYAAVSNLGSPGRGGHRYAMAAAETAYLCRERAAKLFNVRDAERIIFTMNATHALNIAIGSLVHEGSRVVVSGYEHNSVMRPLRAAGARVYVARSPLFEGEVAASVFEDLLRKPADACVVNHVSNVFGSIMPLERIAAICRERGVPLIIDASQSAGTIPIDNEALGAAFIAMPGHKGLYGPQGTGILIANHSAEPLMQGGSGSNSRSPLMPDFLPDRLEAGTHNMPGIAGLSQGIAYVLRHGEGNILSHERALISEMAESLRRLPGVKVYRAADTAQQAGVLSFEVEGRDAEEVGEELSNLGFALRAGLHCAPLAHETAGTIERGTIRASVSAFNTQAEIRSFIRAMERVTRVAK